ncbi:P-II family nitrogen regulator [Planctomycetota bacterium]
MKLITAVIRPERLEAVKDALAEVEVFRMTVGDVHGYVAEESGSLHREEADPLPLQRWVRLEIAVNEAFLEPTLTAVTRSARAEREAVGTAGRIFVTPLTDVVRIRTGERGPEAI